MATKSMSYDHAAYLAVIPQNTNTATGSAGNTQKYPAFTSMLLKSITTMASVLSTSIDTPLLFFRATGNGTTAVNTVTCTYTMTTPLGSAAYFANSVLTGGTAVSTSAATTNTLIIGGSPTLLQGDQWWVQKGTDATATVAYSAEMAILPLANVTV